MRNVAAVLVLALLVALATAERVHITHVTANSHLNTPAGWSKLGEADAEHPLKLTFALKQSNIEKLESLFWERSHPASDTFGQWLSLDEIADLVQPTAATVNTVTQFLKSYGVEGQLSLSKDFLTVVVPVEVASQLMETEFHLFQHTDGRQHVTTVQRYSVPEEVASVIDFVTGLSGFPEISPKYFVPESADAAQAAFPVTPQVLRQRYNISTTNFGQNETNSQSVAEFQSQYYSPTDLKKFYSSYWPQNPNYDVTKVVGSNDPSNPGGEASLDIQFIKGVAPSAKTWFWSNPAFDFFSDLTAWINQMNSEPNNPWVHSISYGDQGALTKPASDYQTRFDTEMKKLGLRGVSIIFASGDSGTGCEACLYFSPSFPATAPSITSVGATRFLNNAIGEEAAVESFGSGGGFSYHFAIPSYQADDVSGYFSSGVTLPASRYYTTTGRGTPDVSALGIGFQVLVDGAVESIGGTSASAPTFAGVITLINNERLNAGKTTLGFLNPFLYDLRKSNEMAFFDVVVGENQSGCCGWTGFNCYKGWDPVTGLGTPNYPQILAAAMKLP